MRKMTVALGCVCVSMAVQPQLPSADDLLTVDRAFQQSVVFENQRIVADWFIASGYYLYKDGLELLVDPAVVLGDIRQPDGITKQDPHFGAVEVYYDSVRVSAPVLDGEGTVDVTVKYQGCAESGFCYPPQVRVVPVKLDSP